MAWQEVLLKTIFDANTILAANSDNTPAAVAIAEQQVVGRITAGNIKGLSVAELQALLFSAELPNNVGIEIDSAMSTDGKWQGIWMDGTAGATLAFGEVCYLAVADSRWELADNNAAATATMLMGICILAAASDGDATKMLLIGKICADTAFPALTVGAPVFLDATAGDITTTLPTKATGRIVRVIGHALSAYDMFFNPDGIWIEYA